MKKSIFGKIGAAAVVLTLVTSSLVGGTFAKYATYVDATAKATVAKWGVAFKDGEDVISDSTEIKLLGSGQDGKILPGDDKSFTINIAGSGSDVGFDYTIKIAPATEGPNDLYDKVVFYTKNAEGTVTQITQDNGITGTVAYSTTTGKMDRDIEIFWKLPESTTNEGADAEKLNNLEDTKLAGLEASYKISMNAIQNAAAIENGAE